MREKELIQAALQSREKAYAPYSGFSVGAALLTKSGKIYTGCNIENASFSPTNCAERTAFFKAISEGERDFLAIAVCGGARGMPPAGYCTPCGVCRQVMAEFCDPKFEIYCGKTANDYKVYTLDSLLPESFGLTADGGGKKTAREE